VRINRITAINLYKLATYQRLPAFLPLRRAQPEDEPQPSFVERKRDAPAPAVGGTADGGTSLFVEAWFRVLFCLISVPLGPVT